MPACYDMQVPPFAGGSSAPFRRVRYDVPMTEEQETILAALDKGVATRQQQREAARMIRDLENSVRELSELNQRG